PLLFGAVIAFQMSNPLAVLARPGQEVRAAAAPAVQDAGLVNADSSSHLGLRRCPSSCPAERNPPWGTHHQRQPEKRFSGPAPRSSVVAVQQYPEPDSARDSDDAEGDDDRRAAVYREDHFTRGPRAERVWSSHRIPSRWT